LLFFDDAFFVAADVLLLKLFLTVAFIFQVGQRLKVLVTDKAPDGRNYVGKTKAYEQVLVPKDKRVMGKLIEVEVLAESRFEMTAKIIEESIDQAPVRPPPVNS
jgi:hypothetical protein